jgi:SOS response regulatory protein OraA/RecX
VTGGRTVWWAKDSAWWRRELIVELGEEFGAAGPAVIDWLACEAKAQNDSGCVKAGRKTVARGCFVEVATVSNVLSRSVTLGLLEDFKEDGSRFTCRISGWLADNERASAAARQSRKRALSDGLSRSVTDGHEKSHKQDRTEVKSSLRSDIVEQPLDQPDNSQVEELFEYWRSRCHHPNAKLTKERKAKVQARLREGYTAEQIRHGIDGAAANPPADANSGVVFDDLVSVCRNGSQLERYIGRRSPRARQPTANGSDFDEFLSRRGA